MMKRGRHDMRPVNWIPDLKAPRHTLRLPVASDKPLKELGREVALNVLGMGTPEDRLDKFAHVVRDGTKSCRDRQVMMGALIFFPDYNRLPPVATLDVSGGHSREPGQPSSLEFYREHRGTPNKNTVGPVEVTDVQLPAGPAIRIHRRYWPKQTLAPTAHLWEEVSFAVRPPQILETVLLTVSWVELDLSAPLIKIADAVAPTLEIKLDDAC
jgi:hypothetical protein